MSLHPLAGKPAPREMLVNIPRLVSAYYTQKPDLSDPAQRVAFGTSGHRGSSLRGSFNEDHILAVCQAICEHRLAQKITGFVEAMGQPERVVFERQRPPECADQGIRQAQGGGTPAGAKRIKQVKPISSHSACSAPVCSRTCRRGWRRRP